MIELRACDSRTDKEHDDKNKCSHYNYEILQNQIPPTLTQTIDILMIHGKPLSDQNMAL